MKLVILRRDSAASDPYEQTFFYTPESAADTVATALRHLNAEEPLHDASGAPASPIRWDCGCLQKKCGACAMRINGMPRLACDARLCELGETVRLEPLRKFPCVADLIVDRTILMDNLKTMKVWASGDAPVSERTQEAAFEASRCLQCGCCLEICPNFLPGERFGGMAAAVPAARLLFEQTKADQASLAAAYRMHFYAGCGKSLACKTVCPAGIDTEALLVRSNAAVWKSIFRKQKGTI